MSTSGSPNTASATSGGAVIVENTTIGAPGLTFRSVSANGAVNGIRLVNTGATAGLTVTGGGSVAQGGDVSGGTITPPAPCTGSAMNAATVSAPWNWISRSS